MLDHATQTHPHEPCPGSILEWRDARRYPPDTARCVLACDQEIFFIAAYDDGRWCDVHRDEEIDSVVIHWCELPELPGEWKAECRVIGDQ